MHNEDSDKNQNKDTRFTMNELKKYHAIKEVLEGVRTVEWATRVLKLSERQVRRLMSLVKSTGPEGVINGNRGKRSPRAYPDALKDKIVKLKQDKYAAANFCHFRDLLETNEGIKVSYSFIYTTLQSATIKSPKKHRARKIKKLRKRRIKMGDLVQADATPYDFLGTGESIALHGFIDDATGDILGLHLCEHECLFGYLEVTRQMLINYGIPSELYPDRHSVFFPTKSQNLTIEEELSGKNTATTQFGRIMNELGIDMHPAYSSEAKGRVERLWQTLQSRLPVEFKLRNIKTIEEANQFLKTEYIPKFNARFGHKPEDSETMFVPIVNGLDLDKLLTIKFTRKVDRSGTFTYKNHRFQVLSKKVLPHAKVTVRMSEKIGILVEYKDEYYPALCIEDLPSSYSSLNLDKFCKEHSAFTSNFIHYLMGYDAKQLKPLLETE